MENITPTHCIESKESIALREKNKKNAKNWSFGPTGGPPFPPPRKLVHLKVKKNRCLFCILDYSEHFNFS